MAGPALTALSILKDHSAGPVHSSGLLCRIFADSIPRFKPLTNN
jgi:hypothetical protein